MHSCDESLFLALNFDGGPRPDRGPARPYTPGAGRWPR